MNQESVYRRAMRLAVPIMIQNGITNAVGLVDHVMVGSLGTEAMTAVSIVGQLIFVFNLAIFGGLSGPGIYGAQFYGQKNAGGVRASFRMKLLICGACLLGGLTVFLLAGEPLIGLYLKGESAEVDPVLTVAYGMRYLRIMLLGLAPFTVTQIYSGTLRETGDSVRPMIAGIVSVASDVLFNYLLIYGKCGFPRLGVAGAALGTVFARVLEMTVMIVLAHRKKNYPYLKGVYRTLRIPPALRRQMLTKSLPIFCNEFLWAGGVAAMTQCYSVRGLFVVSAVNISNVLCNLLNVVFVALGVAVGILTGQRLGRSEFEEAKHDSFRLIRFTGAVCLILTVALIVLSGVFPRFYDTTPRIRSMASQFIVVTALFFPMQGCLNALYFTLRSGGRTFVTFLFDSFYSWMVMVPLTLLLCRKTVLPVLTVYAIVQFAEAVKVMIGYVMIRKGIWISNLAEQSGSTVQQEN